MKTYLLPLSLAACAAALFVGCEPAGKKKADAPVTVLTARVTTTNVPVQIDPPPVGHVTAFSTVTVHSQIGGLIQAVHFKEGQEVKKGDRLFSIDPRPTQAALAQAQAALQRDAAQLEYAQANFTREQKLFDQKLISQDELDTNRASLDAISGTVAADKAAIANAQLNLEFCEIRSPIDGRAGSLQSFVGNVVKAPDDALLTITQIRPIYVAFSVPEQYLPQIKSEMALRTLQTSVTYENMEVKPPQGELTFVDNTVDPTTGQIQLRATFPNADTALWPGQFVQLKLTLKTLTNAVVVPSQAVQTGQTNQYVYVVTSNPTNTETHIVQLRPVTVGIDYDNQTVVTKGLKAGETVVTDGQLRLAPGVKVTVKSSLQAAAKKPSATGTATNTPAGTNAP
ncbi:MAG TPA: efflux RND transporter periplasmic adaptor subunit [Verrucomicrobiae bacterium]|jgi:multidrug efflux system membrane fusion protein